MANYMAEVAKMLGVELGEEFKCSNGCVYAFDENGLTAVEAPLAPPSYTAAILYALCNGNLTIKRIPWKPAPDECYYSVTEEGLIDQNVCAWDFIDISLYRIGNCYRTREEAKANRDKWISFYSSDEVLEV